MLRARGGLSSLKENWLKVNFLRLIDQGEPQTFQKRYTVFVFRVTLVSPQDFLEKTSEKYGTSFTDKIENSIAKPARSKKKSK